MDDCPDCGAPMTKRSSRRVGSFIERYRRCPKCKRRDKVLARPEEILSVVLYLQQEPDRKPAATG